MINCRALGRETRRGEGRGGPVSIPWRNVEAGLVTSGDDLPRVTQFMTPGTTRYTAADVITATVGACPFVVDP
jgi:hypothetical protein